jgi:replicative DNA helicase
MIGKDTGKKLMAIASTTPVPTPSGWVLAKDLKPADYIFQPRGGAQAIGSVQTYIPAECYRATFDDGLEIEGDRHMALALQDKVWRHHQVLWFKGQSSKYAKKKFRRPLKVKTLAELSKDTLEYPTMDLPVPPYVFGLWLGSLEPSGRHFLTGKDFNYLQRMVRPFGFSIVKNNYHGRREFTFRPSVRESFTYARAEIPTEIPQYYLESNVESRELLLQGLIDAKNVNEHNGKHVVYDSWLSVRRKQQLAEGLGYKTKLSKINSNANYQLSFPKKQENPALMRRFLVKVEKITAKQCVHIAVNGEFVAGEGFLAVC